MAINIIDRALGKKSFEKKKIQLLAITSLYIAAKYEEIMVPKISNFSALASDDVRISKNNILQVERTLLPLLNFDFSYVAPSIFIDLLVQKFGISAQKRESILSICCNLMKTREFKYECSSRLAWLSIS